MYCQVGISIRDRGIGGGISVSSGTFFGDINIKRGLNSATFDLKTLSVVDAQSKSLTPLSSFIMFLILISFVIAFIPSLNKKIRKNALTFAKWFSITMIAVIVISQDVNETTRIDKESNSQTMFQMSQQEGKIVAEGSGIEKNLNSQITTSGSYNQPSTQTTSSNKEAEDFIYQWQNCQNNKNIADYIALYSQNFEGVKRTKDGKTETYNYSEWVSNRASLIGKGYKIEIKNLNIEESCDEDPWCEYIVTFDQYYYNPRYSDWGPKEIRIRKEDGKLKIVYEEMKASYSLSNSGENYYECPDSNKRLLTISDLQGKSNWQLDICRNEIYARQGYVFEREDLKNYFEDKNWYIKNFNFSETSLNSIEKKNAVFIKEYQNNN